MDSPCSNSENFEVVEHQDARSSPGSVTDIQEWPQITDRKAATNNSGCHLANTPGSALRNTQPSRFETYDNILKDQARELQVHTSVQVLLLKAVTYSARVLRLNEVADLLGHAFPGLDRNPKAIVRSVCGSLLEILEDETVQIVHPSVAEFLLGVEDENLSVHGRRRVFPILHTGQAHKDLTILCLAYLQAKALSQQKNRIPASSDMDHCDVCDVDQEDCCCDETDRSTNAFDYNAARLEHPFLQYAVTNWAYHANRYNGDDEEFLRAVTSFAHAENPAFRIWSFIEYSNTTSIANAELPSAWHIAAFAGLTTYANSRLRDVQGFEKRDCDGRTPLWLAARRNHGDMVTLLLQRGADADADDHQGVKPIHEAAKQNHASIVRKLLQAGVDLLTPKTRENHSGRLKGGERSTRGETAAQYACREGHAETIGVMIPFAKPETLAEMLRISCGCGKYEAVRTLLEHSNVSPDSTDDEPTPLYLATLATSVECVRALLARGANVHLASKLKPKRRLYSGHVNRPRQLPLHVLSQSWTDDNDLACQEILKLLMAAGSDVNCRDSKGDTPLMCSFLRYGPSKRAAVAGLVNAGADVSMTDRDGKNVLHRYLEVGQDIRILQLLVDRGADLHARGKNGETVWHKLPNSATDCSQEGFTSVVRFLLEHGAGPLCQVPDDRGQTGLQLAVRNLKCTVETFRLLLQACPDLPAREQCLWSLADRPSKEDVDPFLRELLVSGVSLEARDSRGLTVLLSNVDKDQFFKAVVDCGARLDALDAQGKSVLHRYIISAGGHAHVSRLQELVNMGLDPCVKGFDGNTLLHEVAASHFGYKSSAEVVRQILEYGVNANDQNLAGLTAVHVYLEHHQSDSSYSPSPQGDFLESILNCAPDLQIDAQDRDGLAPLHLAAIRCESDLKLLLAAGAKVDILTHKGENALHLACRARMSNNVGLLLHRASDLLINQVNSLGHTPLHIACRSGRLESVYYLLQYGADVSAKDHEGRTPLHSCAEYSVEQRLWFLLEHADGSKDPYVRDRLRPCGSKKIATSGQPWYVCAWQSSPNLTGQDTAGVGSIVVLLIKAGAAVVEQDVNNYTPLDLALHYDCHDMINALRSSVDQTGNLWRSDRDDMRLSTLVKLYNRSRLSSGIPEPQRQEILKHPGTYATWMNVDDIQFLLEHGGDVTGEKSGFTEPSLLHIAVRNGLLEIMEEMKHLGKFFDDHEKIYALLKETKSTKVHASYVSPLVVAACERKAANLPMLQFLIESCGVDVNARALTSDSYSRVFLPDYTALHLLARATHWWYLDAIRLLVRHGAVVDSKDKDGETPLHVACRGVPVMTGGHRHGIWAPACVELLLELGADPNYLDGEGRSSLHKAAQRTDIIEILLKHGADLSAGKSNPLFSAIEMRDVHAVAAFSDAGASPNLTDTTNIVLFGCNTRKKRTALLYAALHGCPDIVQVLVERGADVLARADDGETLLHYVFEHAERSVVSALLDLAGKFDLHARDQQCRTVLLAACDSQWKRYDPSNSRAPVIRLLELGADILAVDQNGRNALHHLMDNPAVPEETILEFLQHDECRHLLHLKDTRGFTPLQRALRTLRPLICEKLVEMGSDLLDADPFGQTALHHIASQYLRVYVPAGRYYHRDRKSEEYYAGCRRLWRRFLALGGDINARDHQGCSPLLLYLSSPAQEDLTREDDCCHAVAFPTLFADSTVDVFARNTDGETALHVIARRPAMTAAINTATSRSHDKKLFEYMLEKGLDPLAEDASGRSSLDVAAASGKREIPELFRHSPRAMT